MSPRVGGNITSVLVVKNSSLSCSSIRVYRGQTTLGDLSQTVAGFIFEFWVFSERNTNSVTQTISKKSSNTNGRLHATIFTFTGFSHTQVKGVIPSKAVHFSSQKTITLDHNKRVTGLHGKDKVVEILGPTNVCKFNGGLNHTTRSITIIRKNARTQGTVIGTNTHATIEFFALFNKRVHRFHEIRTFHDVVLFTFIYFFFEIFLSVSKVTRIDTDLFNGFSNH
mmetsp:Transcript_26501/g.37214  ORF Transcript_26501/g.37214 Transcript_26501/m.37214 type:complete len:224 (-) Transcript_26501:549-1220(-)